jgi:hypothetical protein
MYLQTWRKPLAVAAVPLVIWMILPMPIAEWSAIFATIVAGLIPYLIVTAMIEFDAVGFAASLVRIGRRRVPLSDRP